jgi:hypothetical protein
MIANDNKPYDPTDEEFEELLREAERLGILEKLRDAQGNVVTELDSSGEPAIVYRRTNVMPMDLRRKDQ